MRIDKEVLEAVPVEVIAEAWEAIVSALEAQAPLPKHAAEQYGDLSSELQRRRCLTLH